MNYIGESELDNTAQGEQLPVNKVDSVLYHNLSGSYDFNENFRLYAAINNVADKEPPGLPGLNYDGLLYDAVGRYFSLGITYEY